MSLQTTSFHLQASPLFFDNAYDTQSAPFPLAHLLNLEGGTSLSLGKFHKSYEATGVFTFSRDTQTLLHGFYVSPSLFNSSVEAQEPVRYLATKGWAISAGRANISYPQSIYRGFVQFTYRQAKVDASNSTNQNLVSELGLIDPYREIKSFLFSVGAATTPSSLVSQKRPLLDSEILVSLRYDYETGNFYSWFKGSILIPTFMDLGATAGWYKIFNETENTTNSKVTDAFFMGPRIRARFFKKHLALDSSFLWPLYRSFDGKALFTNPRLDLILMMSF